MSDVTVGNVSLSTSSKLVFIVSQEWGSGVMFVIW